MSGVETDCNQYRAMRGRTQAAGQDVFRGVGISKHSAMSKENIGDLSLIVNLIQSRGPVGQTAGMRLPASKLSVGEAGLRTRLASVRRADSGERGIEAWR